MASTIVSYILVISIVYASLAACDGMWQPGPVASAEALPIALLVSGVPPFELQTQSIQQLHKNLLPLNGADAAMLCIAAATLFLAAGGGIGGGAVFVVLYSYVGGFMPSAAVALSNVTILGGAVANFCILSRRRRGDSGSSDSSRPPLINWDLCLLMEPCTMLGALLGSNLNRVRTAELVPCCAVLCCAVLCCAEDHGAHQQNLRLLPWWSQLLPPWLTAVLLTALLAVLSVNTIGRGRQLYAAETRALRAASSTCAAGLAPSKGGVVVIGSDDAHLHQPLLQIEDEGSSSGSDGGATEPHQRPPPTIVKLEDSVQNGVGCCSGSLSYAAVDPASAVAAGDQVEQQPGVLQQTIVC